MTELICKTCKLCRELTFKEYSPPSSTFLEIMVSCPRQDVGQQGQKCSHTFKWNRLERGVCTSYIYESALKQAIKKVKDGL